MPTLNPGASDELPLRAFMDLTGDRRNELNGLKWRGEGASPRQRSRPIARTDAFLPTSTRSTLHPDRPAPPGLTMLTLLECASLPTGWEPAHGLHRGVPSGGATHPLEFQLKAVSPSRWLDADLVTSQRAWRVVDQGPSPNGAATGTTIFIYASPGRISADYGLFGCQLLLMELGGIIEQIRLLANAAGHSVRVSVGGHPEGGGVLVSLNMSDDGAVADLPSAPRSWCERAEPPADDSTRAVIDQLFRERTDTTFRPSKDERLDDLIRAARRRTSGPADPRDRPHRRLDLSPILKEASELGGSGDLLVIGPDEAKTVLIAAASQQLSDWTGYRCAMLAAGAVMQRLCMAAALNGLWARPLRQNADSVLNARLPFSHQALLEMDFGRLSSTLWYPA